MYTPPSEVDLLILGAGWTSTFLIPLCVARGVSYAATSRPARPKPDTILFEFDENSEHPDPAQFARLPWARTVLVTFPVRVPGAAARLVSLYEQTHDGAQEGREKVGTSSKAVWIQLGSTGIFDGGPTLHGQSAVDPRTRDTVWIDRHSPYDRTNTRAAAEDEFLALSPNTPTTVLNLCGLWGGPRAAKNFIGRVAPTKEALRAKTSVHMMHGEDVARAILAVHDHFEPAVGQRWMVTDARVYDWWDLAGAWGDEHTKDESEVKGGKVGSGTKGPHARWVRELMNEEGVRALPRSVEILGKGLDSREFWNTFNLQPTMTRLE